MPRSKELSEQMRAQSRERIIRAARQLFAERGYFKCKVSDIAQRAEMSQGNVYWYFRSKEELLQAVLAQGFQALEQMTQEVAEAEGGGLEKLNDLLTRTWSLYDEQGDFNRILMSLMAHGGPGFMLELGFDMSDLGRRYHTNLIRVFAQARSEGLVTDVDPNMLVMLYFSLFNGLMITYAQDWQTLPADVLQQAALRMLGVSAT
ncbi:MAG TPA: TetR/AcrR family transcriptional regulator [Anaerolineae bacterium]|nr:TetR/AcrR family transcriptional regulator [Anaerolineae bacterium]